MTVSWSGTEESTKWFVNTCADLPGIACEKIDENCVVLSSDKYSDDEINDIITIHWTAYELDRMLDEAYFALDDLIDAVYYQSDSCCPGCGSTDYTKDNIHHAKGCSLERAEKVLMKLVKWYKRKAAVK